MRSKQSIIDQHLQFCKTYNITVTDQQLNTWSQTPARFLANILAKDRVKLATKVSSN
jgi:hypothetical protein